MITRKFAEQALAAATLVGLGLVCGCSSRRTLAARPAPAIEAVPPAARSAEPDPTVSALRRANGAATPAAPEEASLLSAPWLAALADCWHAETEVGPDGRTRCVVTLEPDREAGVRSRAWAASPANEPSTELLRPYRPYSRSVDPLPLFENPRAPRFLGDDDPGESLLGGGAVQGLVTSEDGPAAVAAIRWGF